MTNDKIPILVAAIVPPNGELYFADNLTGPCATCGALLQYRPHAPTPHILRCLRCTADEFLPGETFTTTPQMIEDCAEFFRKRKH
jgi:hypothetical protein